MVAAPISFLGRDGVRRWSHDLATDSDDVLLELAWAHPKGRPICSASCPMADGPDTRRGYCVDCHMVASSARSVLAARRERAASGGVGEPAPAAQGNPGWDGRCKSCGRGTISMDEHDDDCPDRDWRDS